MYHLNKNDLRVFEALCEGVESTKDIADATSISAASVYRALDSLSSSGLVEGRRNGKSIRAYTSRQGHSRALCSYLEGGRRPIEPLVGSRFLILLSVSSNPKQIERVAEEVNLSRESVRRIVWLLRKYGAISQEKNIISIPPTDTRLARCLKDYSKGACEALLESLDPSGTMLWNEGLEFIFSARRTVKAPGVSETGITAMARRGLRFVSDRRYYHYAHWNPRLRKEDISIHQIMIDLNSARNITYGLLFLMKEGYSSAYLARLGDAMGAQALTEQIETYLNGGTVKNPHFPNRAEMAELRAQYGVD